MGVYVLYNSTSSAGALVWGTDEATWTLPSGVENVSVRAVVKSANVNTNGQSIFPTISTTSGISPEKYTGGQASPNPSYPQEIKYVRGKNKFDIGTSLNDYFQTNTNGTKPGSWTVNAVTATIEGNKLTIDTYNSSGWNWLSKWVELEPNTDYTISGTNTSVLKVVGFNSNELQTQGTQIIQKTANASDSVKTFNSGDYKYYCLSCFPEATGKYFENIQIEEGTQATSYLPYNTIEEVVSGKNLVDVSKNVDGYAINSSGQITSSEGFNYTELIPVSQGTHIYSGKRTSSESTNRRVHAYNSSGTWIKQINAYTPAQGDFYYTINIDDDNIKYLRLSYTNTDTNVMVEQGSTATTYEPYITPTTYQLSLGDRKVFDGDYLWIDRTTGKKYHHHASTKYDFTGQEGASSMGWTDKGAWRVTIPNLKQTTELTDLPNVLCNKLKADTQNNVFSGGAYGIANARNSSDVIIRNDDLISYTTQQVVSWLSTNAVYLVHKLATETDEEITGTLAEQLEAWWNGQSLDGTTIIEGNGDLPLLIEVRALKAS